MTTYKIIAIFFLVIVLGIVIIQNRGPVQTHLLFITIEMPLILLLLLIASGGFALGLLVALFSRSKPSGMKTEG